MDALQKLAWDSDVCCAVLGKGNDVELVDLNQFPSPEILQHLARRGLQFIGVLGYKDGRVRVEIEGGATVEATRILVIAAQSFTGWIAPKGDFVEWARRMYEAPDPRG
jgi:hypothetical protein